MISIIIPVYNHRKELDKCLASIERQTYKEFEVIIVDDGSTSPVGEEFPIFDFQFPIKIFRMNHAGANAARNYGFKQSKGAWLLFCDADIEMKPLMLEKMLAALQEHPEAAYAYSSFKFGWKTFRLWPFNGEKLKAMNYIHTTSLIRREAFPASGWDESLKRFQDWDVWLTMLEHGHTGVWVPEVLFKVKAGGTMSRWLPKATYGFARRCGVKVTRIEDYEAAKKIIQQKHNLTTSS